MAQFGDTQQKSRVIAFNFEHQSRVLIDCPSCQRSMNSQSNRIKPRRPCTFQGADARRQKTWRGSLCVLLTRHHGTFNSVTDGRWLHRKSQGKRRSKSEGHRNATSEERKEQTQFPVFHKILLMVTVSMFHNEIVRHTAHKTLVIFLCRNYMLNLTRVKVYVNSAVRQGSRKGHRLPRAQDSWFWKSGNGWKRLPVHSAYFGGTWRYLNSSLPP